MKRLFLAVATFAIVGSLGLPANAAGTKVPFNFFHFVGGFSQALPTGQAQNPGFVGVCDIELQCYGLRLAESTTNSALAVSQTLINVAGYICVQDETAPCGSAEDPGTGVVFTSRQVYAPMPSITGLTIHAELCVWAGTPRDNPTLCFPVDVATDTITGIIGSPVPQDIGSALLPPSILL